MTDADARARRATTQLGDLEIKGCRLPNSNHRISQTRAAKAIDESPVYALHFLSSKDSKALLGNTYTGYTPKSIEVESKRKTYV